MSIGLSVYNKVLQEWELDKTKLLCQAYGCAFIMAGREERVQKPCATVLSTCTVCSLLCLSIKFCAIARIKIHNPGLFAY